MGECLSPDGAIPQFKDAELFRVGDRAAVEGAVRTPHRCSVGKLQQLDLAVQTRVGVAVRRHDLKRDAAQPPRLQQTFELLSPHHCAPDWSTYDRLLQHKVDGRSRVTIEDRLPGQTGDHHPFHVVLRVRRLRRFEESPSVLCRLQQPMDAVGLVDADLDGLPLQLGQLAHLLGIPDLLDVLPRRGDEPARPQHLVGPVQILLSRNPLPALDLVDQVLAVPDRLPELGGPHAHRLAPQLQLATHRGDHGHAPLVVGVDVPPRVDRLAVHAHPAPLRRTSIPATPLPRRPPPTARTRPDKLRTVTVRTGVVTVHGKHSRPR